MLVWTARTSRAWQPEVPQVSSATRKSPGLTNWMYSLFSFSQLALARTGLAELFHMLAMLGFGWACFLRLIILRVAGFGSRRRLDRWIAAVTIGAAQPYGARGMHRWRIGLPVTRDAAGAFAVSLLLRLQQPRAIRLLGHQKSAKKSYRDAASAGDQQRLRNGNGHWRIGRAKFDWWRFRGSLGTDQKR